ncbi:LysR family transcriptional regulator [Burkholderia vietnamiensis]|uniref:LysR family transcriptional regulator n=1 Tax=Burkholderia TaxID=32008 RepID=UPI000556BCAA|nr:MULTISPECIES: LysR family transcriptional regulator [Burkholderia]KVF74721.1 transcriptional regulator [Burkholderia vietnamiensis]KVF89928.1 transcriptional regulator [Burkholderia vietnamiensis]KVF90099.1 transcriptional regulator [Burkholderia vietnamiensis]KVF95288.1 transcriptional regulator [Burkholderia vietnamiensis]KVR95998.1 transcriptional regulator [Burkholderia vietnamiensis]
MELRHLRYFLAVAAASNFTKAAQALGIGQPPLSQQIRALEDELGVELFKRTARGAELTVAGEVFAEEARRVLDDAERAARAAKRAARGEIGQLRVGFTGTAAFNSKVADLIRRFREAFPDTELTLLEATSGVLFDALEAGRLDVGIVRPERRIADTLHAADWDEEPMFVALPVAHRLARRRRIELAELTDEAFVQVPREAGSALFDDIVAACNAAGFQPRMAQPAPQIASAVTLVAAGLGVSIVPMAITQVQVAGVVYRPVAGDGLRARLAIASRRDAQSPVVRNFLALAW